MTIGAMARVDAAESFAQKCPCGAENDAMNWVSGAASMVVRFSVQNASFHARMTFNNTVEAMPGIAIGVSTKTISFHVVAPSMRAASRMSFGISLK